MNKKIFLIFILFLLSGCSTIRIDDMSYDDCVSIALKKDIKVYNTNNVGYRYYLPRGFTVLEDKKYNQKLMFNQNKYYLYVDIISYYNKKPSEHIISSDEYHYKDFTYRDKKGYLSIIKNNDYFFIEMMYNYAIIEVIVIEDDIKEAIVNMSFILSSIEYNDMVIETLTGKKALESVAKPYQLLEPEGLDNKNFLEYAEEYDTYDTPDIKDNDVIGN